MGWRVGKKSAFKFICRPIVSIISVSLMVVVSVFTLAYNILICALLRDICRVRVYHAMRIFRFIGVYRAMRIVRFHTKTAYCVHY